MSINRRRSLVINQTLFYNNRVQNFFKPRNGVVAEYLEHGSSIWSSNGNNIYNTNSENVGVGVYNPLTALDVSGTINSSSDITIDYIPISPPIGSIIAYTAAAIPSGWLLCNGTAISRAVYASLFKIIGTTFGTGNNTTTFNLPNYQGAFLRGTGTNGNYSGPAANTSQNHATQTHSHTSTSTVTDPGHNHTQYSVNDDYNNTGGGYPGTTPSFPPYDSAGSKTWTNINSNSTGITVATTVANSTTSVDANETRPYNFGVYWIIKY
jgi:microcystin-dependent protein